MPGALGNAPGFPTKKIILGNFISKSWRREFQSNIIIQFVRIRYEPEIN